MNITATYSDAARTAVAVEVVEDDGTVRHITGDLPLGAPFAHLLDGVAIGAYAAAPVDLRAYAASARYDRETGGITVAGVKIATDRASQALITGAWATVQMNPQATIAWKGGDGTFVSLTAAQVTGVASAVTAHVQACFAAEAQVDADIAAGKVTTAAQVDAAFAAVTA